MTPAQQSALVDLYRVGPSTPAHMHRSRATLAALETMGYARRVGEVRVRRSKLLLWEPVFDPTLSGRNTVRELVIRGVMT